jgi:DNA-binding Lrp family transcriptional regulator
VSRGLAAAPGVSSLERRLLDEYQNGFPLSPAPYAEIAARLGVTEHAVLEGLRALGRRGLVSRVGAVLSPGRAGASTLAAMSVPPDRLDEVAGLVSAYGEVNHNYEREHRINLWFVVTAADSAAVRKVLGEIEERTGIAVCDLPLLEAYHIDLGFPLWR